MNKVLNYFAKVIGILEVIGGIWGIIHVITLGTSNANLGLIIGSFIFIFCFASGLLLLFNTNYSLEISMLNQLIQVVSFSGAGISLRYFTPFSFEIALINESGLVLDFFVSSKLLFSFNESQNFEFISINLLALFFLLSLNRLRNRD